jgi:flavodoxin
MKTLIILFSHHHKNTDKIAQVIAGVLEAEIKKTQQVDPSSLSEYDLVGFGSGIYFRKMHKSLLKLAENIPNLPQKKAFIFSTSGEGKGTKHHKELREKLRAKGFNILSEFNCPGKDTYGLTKLVGGIQKSRPNGEDLRVAEEFAKELKV